MAQQIDDVRIDLIETLARDLYLSQADLLAGLHVTARDAARWQATGRVPSESVLEHLKKLQDLRDGLYELFAKPDGVEEWMGLELRYLHWKTPRQVIQDGQPEKAYAAFIGLASGIFL